MIRHSVAAALLASSALMYPATAAAQGTTEQQVEELQARIAALQVQVEALQQSLEGVKAAQAKPTPSVSWKGAPLFEDKEAGWSFKPRGRLMYDLGWVESPDGISNAGLGFSNEVRRARLGVEGTVPGGFGYKFELDFAAGEVEFADALLNYKKGPWDFTIGQHNNFQSLDELTSSLHSSFIERAAFTDAFGFERRVGVSAQYARGAFLAQAGLFTDSISDLNAVGDDNNSIGGDVRLVYAPMMGTSQLHFGVSAHQRELNDAGSTVRYRQRPAVHTTDVRFIDTGTITGVDSEAGLGLEAAGIFGPFHIASEAYLQKVRRDGDDPAFFGAYVEGGYFLTGESRGYKGGKFDRVKVRNGFDKGGWGSLGVNLRWDYLDLTDQGFVGGTQNAFQASLNWKPVDYLLLGLNAGHILYDDAAILADGDRDYSVNVAGMRAQVDF